MENLSTIGRNECVVDGLSSNRVSIGNEEHTSMNTNEGSGVERECIPFHPS